MQTIWLTGAAWLVVLRVGLGLWWLESWRHKDKKGWFERGTGILGRRMSPPNTAGPSSRTASPRSWRQDPR